MKYFMGVILLCFLFTCFSAQGINGSQASPFLDTTHLFLTAELDFNRKLLEGTAELTFAPFAEEPAFLRLDATALFIIQVEVSKDQGKKYQAVAYSLTREWLDISAPEGGFGVEPLRVRIRYRCFGAGDVTRGPGFGPGLEFVNEASLGGMFAFTSVEPRRARSWYPCVDRPDDQFLYQGQFTVPAGNELISNGTLLSKTYQGQKVTFVWKHHFEIASYLVSIAAGPYVLILDRYEHIPIEYWVPKALLEKAQKDFKRTPEMMKLFSEYFCLYPFEKYATVVVPGYGGAMEHTTATTYGHNLVTGDLTHERIVAHELGHHWFGDMVTCATWDDLWLNEGFAMFMELLWAEHIDGKTGYEKKLEHFRREYLRHWENHKTAVYDPETAPEDKFHDTTYEKGGFVLHLLRQEMGNDKFRTGLRDYLHSLAFKNANTKQLQYYMEKAYGASLEDFFQTWVYGKGHPLLEIELVHTEKGSVIHLLQKKNPDFKKETLSLEVLFENNSKMFRKIELPFSGERVEHSFPEEFGTVLGVVIAEEYSLLAEIEIRQSVTEWLSLYHSADRLKIKEQALLEVAKLAPERIPEMVLSLWNTGESQNVKMAFRAMNVAYRQKKGLPVENKTLLRLLPYLTSQEVELRRDAVYATLALFQERGSLNGLASEEKMLRDELYTRLAQDSEMKIAWDIAIDLAKLKDPELFPLLKAEIERPGDWARGWLKQGILEAFGYLNDRQGLKYLQQYVSHENEWMRRAAVIAVGHLQEVDVLWDHYLLERLFDSKEPNNVRNAVIRAYEERLSFLKGSLETEGMYSNIKRRLEKGLEGEGLPEELQKSLKKLLQER